MGTESPPLRTSLSAFAGLNSNRASGNAGNAQNQDREPAEFWLNIGYETIVNNDGTEEKIFVSLGLGIPLDQIKTFDVSKARTPNMASLRDAQNQLHEMFMTEAATLEPGQDKLIIVDDQIGLAVQLKRVRAEMEAPAENALAKKITFRQAAA